MYLAKRIQKQKDGFLAEKMIVQKKNEATATHVRRLNIIIALCTGYSRSLGKIKVTTSVMKQP